MAAYRWKQDKFAKDGKEMWVSWKIYVGDKPKYFIGIDAPYPVGSNPGFFFAFLKKSKHGLPPFLESFNFQSPEDIRNMLDALEVPIGGRPPYRATYERIKKAA